MARALIQTANQSTQAVAANSIISLGSVQRRYGCNCRLSGNGIELVGDGYYLIDCNVSVTPTEAGNVTVGVYADGVQVPGAIAYGTTGALGETVTLPIESTVRLGCCCANTTTLTVVLIEGAGEVVNISTRVQKA